MSFVPVTTVPCKATLTLPGGVVAACERSVDPSTGDHTRFYYYGHLRHVAWVKGRYCDEDNVSACLTWRTNGASA